jgi:hypothetical protein
MPAYCYTCSCGHEFARVLPVISCRKSVRCPKCHSLAKRDIAREHGGNVHRPGNWPLKSDAAGVHPLDVTEAMAHASSIGIPTDFTADGRAVFTSARHRKAYCQAIGMYDRNGGFSDPQRK